MTDPDQPFRRPQQERLPGNNRTGASEQPATPANRTSEGLLILDPELHPSVWKSRHEPAGPSEGGRGGSSLTASHTKKRRARAATIVGALGLTLALVAAVVVPRLLHTPTWPAQPLVVDISTRPEIAWRSAGGQPCVNPSDADRAIVSDTRHVWSLDLTNGQTIWSVDLDGDKDVTCLPGADLVAVTLIDPGRETTLGTKILSASSGAEVAELSGEASTHVIPLGSDIGLVDHTNMLKAVQPGKLDSPLWSRQLPGPRRGVTRIVARDVDDDVVQVSCYSYSGDGEDIFTLTVTKADGTSPSWSPGSSTGYAEYQRLGNVITQQGEGSASVFDLRGQKLWDLGDDQLGTAGSQLYVSWPSSSDPSTGYTNLHKVDPRTGTKINGDAYQGWFDYTVAVKDHIAVLRGGTLYILDEHLQEQPTISVGDFSIMYAGQKWVYAESEPDREGEAVLSAIDPDGARVLWTRDLAPGQHLRQLGRHLLLVDEDETFHGLTGRS